MDTSCVSNGTELCVSFPGAGIVVRQWVVSECSVYAEAAWAESDLAFFIIKAMNSQPLLPVACKR